MEVDIGKLSPDSRAVARVDGKVVFVHGALPGERVRVRYTARRRDFDEGVVEEVLRPSPARIEPRCPHFGTCGGCALQHLTPEAQVQSKQQILLENLQRIGRVQPTQVLPALTASPWGYRRRARLSVRHVAKKGRVLVGFRERFGGFVCDTRECHVLVPQVGFQLLPLAAMIHTLDCRDQVPQIEVSAGDRDVILVLRHLVALSNADRQKLLWFAAETGLAIYLQPKGPDSIHPLEREAPLNYSLPAYGLQMEFTAVNFVQINAAINQDMIDLAISQLQLQPEDRVLDLFCGLGNFSLPLARHARHVVGVEGDRDLVALAQRNAATNGIANAGFELADLALADADDPWRQGSFDKVLLDPPRSGAAAILAQVAGFAPGRIVYISCHPGTLARDAGELVHRHGYRLTAAGVMDMFPHTSHVESIAAFEPPKR